MDSAIKKPKVTVLMPVYNGAKYLRESMESILNQDFTDFEFLIINDGSTDDSKKVIASFSDIRIRAIDNEKNLGLINTLNKGLDLASGDYIVRMDQDDISLKTRISVQVKFMEANKHIGASGSYYYLLRNGKKAVADFPLNEKEIKCYMVFNCPIAHPSSIIRRSVLKENKLRYSLDFHCSEDYDFWSRISEVSHLANIPDVLLTYRVHENQITGNVDLASSRYKSVNNIRSRHLKKLGIIPSADELLIHNIISDGIAPGSFEQLISAEKWLKKLIVTNDENNVFHKGYFQKISLERWLRLCINFLGVKKGILYFLKSELYKMIKLPLNRKMELFRNIYNSWKRKTVNN